MKNTFSTIESAPWTIRWKNLWTKWTHWEYLPFEVVYFPVFCYWLWLSVKARSPFFFSASNPGIETGGLIGESKFDILQKISDAYKPQTLFFEPTVSVEDVLQTLASRRMSLPIIAKPDVGERGWMVEKIETVEALENYLSRIKVDFLVQEYVDFPLELGVFYYRFPNKAHGKISSIVQKQFLTVTGDDKRTLQQLVAADARARLQYAILSKRYRKIWSHILPKNAQQTLIFIGNHCLGTKFLNGNHLINKQLQEVFNEISRSVDGFFFGRFDLRCRSLEDLYRGENIRVVELNGAGAEPGHIYDPTVSVWETYRSIFHHWRVCYQISRQNHANGIPYLTFREALATWRQTKANRKLQSA